MINLILFCFGTASLAHFYQKCMDEGMILEKWHNWAQTLPTWVYKPIAGCIFCNSFWIYIITFTVKVSIYPWTRQDFILLFLGIGVQYIWVEIIYKLKE